MLSDELSRARRGSSNQTTRKIYETETVLYGDTVSLHVTIRLHAEELTPSRESTSWIQGLCEITMSQLIEGLGQRMIYTPADQVP